MEKAPDLGRPVAAGTKARSLDREAVFGPVLRVGRCPCIVVFRREGSITSNFRIR
jgi:hypothetical protein